MSLAGVFDKQGYFFSFTRLTHEFYTLYIFMIFQGDVSTVSMVSGGCLLYSQAVAVRVALVGSHLVCQIEHLGCASNFNVLIQDFAEVRAYAENSIDIVFVPNKSSWTVPSVGNPRANVYILYTMKNSSSLMCLICHSIRVSSFHCGFFLSAFISVLIKLSLNNAFPFDFTPTIHKTQEAEKSSQSTFTLDCVTLTFDWLKTICIACFPEKVTLALLILGHM